MGQPGVGVMIGMLGGNKESVEAWKSVVGKKLTAITLENNHLILKTKDGGIVISDDGQSCCESRYMVCDDKLENFVGAKLLGASLENAPEVNGEYSEHEVQFLHIKTSKGSFTVSNHNEHNGYYGGFWIQAKAL